MSKEVETLKTDKIILYVLEQERLTYEAKLEAKINALDELTKYMNQFITVNPKEAFKTDIKKYFISEFENKYKADFPPYLKTEKLLDLLEVSVILLDKLIEKYNYHSIENFNPIKLTAPEPDFNIYAETDEQKERYFQTIGLVTHLNYLRSNFHQGINPSNQICHLLRVVSYNISKQCFSINPKYILNGFN